MMNLTLMTIWSSSAAEGVEYEDMSDKSEDAATHYDQQHKVYREADHRRRRSTGGMTVLLTHIRDCVYGVPFNPLCRCLTHYKKFARLERKINGYGCVADR